MRVLRAPSPASKLRLKAAQSERLRFAMSVAMVSPSRVAMSALPAARDAESDAAPEDVATKADDGGPEAVAEEVVDAAPSSSSVLLAGVTAGEGAGAGGVLTLPEGTDLAAVRLAVGCARAFGCAGAGAAGTGAAGTEAAGVEGAGDEGSSLAAPPRNISAMDRGMSAWALDGLQHKRNTHQHVCMHVLAYVRLHAHARAGPSRGTHARTCRHVHAPAYLAYLPACTDVLNGL